LYIGTHLGSLATGQEKTLIAIRDSGATSVNDEVFLNEYILHQNYPNPFNPSTTIKYQLSSSGIVTLKVYDILGREVTTLVNGFKSEGSYEISFDAKNLSSGVYIYRVTVSNNGRILFTDSKQMLLMK
jgi:Secretion system C-terminal sorting domain